MAALEALYFQTVAFGAGAEVIAAALSAFFTGLGINRVVMVVDTSAALINARARLRLDLRPFRPARPGHRRGRLGHRRLALVSRRRLCRLDDAAAVSAAVSVVERAAFPTPPLFRRLLRYGGPNGLQMLVDVAGFTVFLLLVGTLGPEAMAATTLAFNVNTLAFVPMLGLGIALSTIVGQQLGRNRPAPGGPAPRGPRCGWPRSTWARWRRSTCCCPTCCLLGHAAGTSPEQFRQLHATTVVLLRFVAAYCLFDALNVVFAGVLKGAGDTRFILLTSLCDLAAAGGGWSGRESATAAGDCSPAGWSSPSGSPPSA